MTPLVIKCTIKVNNQIGEYMRLKRTKKYKKIIIISSIVAVIGVGGYSAFAATQSIWPFDSDKADNVDHSPPSDEQRKAGEETSQRVKEDDEPADQENPKQNDGSEGGDVSDIAISITSAEQQNGQLQIRTLIHSVQAGNCTLTLSSDARSITRSAETQSMASSSTCMGFDIPLSEIAAGEWTITIDYQGQDISGTATQIVQVN